MFGAQRRKHHVERAESMPAMAVRACRMRVDETNAGEDMSTLRRLARANVQSARKPPTARAQQYATPACAIMRKVHTICSRELAQTTRGLDDGRTAAPRNGHETRAARPAPEPRRA